MTKINSAATSPTDRGANQVVPASIVHQAGNAPVTDLNSLTSGGKYKVSAANSTLANHVPSAVVGLELFIDVFEIQTAGVVTACQQVCRSYKGATSYTYSRDYDAAGPSWGEWKRQNGGLTPIEITEDIVDPAFAQPFVRYYSSIDATVELPDPTSLDIGTPIEFEQLANTTTIQYGEETETISPNDAANESALLRVEVVKSGATKEWRKISYGKSGGDIFIPTEASMPIGAFMYWFAPTNTIPDGWALADGGVVDQVDYPLAFAVWGHTHGTVDKYGAAIDTDTQFLKPYISGLFVRAIDDGYSNRDEDGVRSVSDVQADANKEHDHNYTPDGHTVAFVDETIGGSANEPYGSSQGTFHKDTAVEPAGGAEARPKNIAAYAIVKIAHSVGYDAATNEANALTLGGHPAAAFLLTADLPTEMATWFANNASLGSSATGEYGYQIFPNGLILQWGHIQTESGTGLQSIVFPLAFPTDACSMFLTDHAGSDGSNLHWWGEYDRTVNGVNVISYSKASGSPSQSNGYFLAIGY